MVLEVGLLVLDIVSDFANGGNFILSGHPFVGGLTIVLVFLPGLVSSMLYTCLTTFTYGLKEMVGYSLTTAISMRNLNAVKMQIIINNNEAFKMFIFVLDSRSHYS
jgi:hypothetical protein